MSAGALGEMHHGHVLIGSSTSNIVTARVNGWSFSTPTPSVVLCQARQSDNTDHGWQDAFVIQVITTGTNFITLRIRRVDTSSSGWGQKLQIDMLVIE
jgi:hypothetical protein